MPSNSKIIQMKNCEHKLCRTCFETIISSRRRNGQGMDACLCLICNKPIHLQTIKLICGNEIAEELEAQTRLMNTSNLLCVNCRTIFSFPVSSERKVQCSACGFSLCTVCGKIFHNGRCNRKDQIEELGSTEKYNVRPCPYCLKFSAKDKNCNHVTCNNCHNAFCFVCSAKRSPILAHGNHYHRPGCPDRGDPYEGPNYFCNECSECVRLGRCCNQPDPLENLDIPAAEWPYERCLQSIYLHQ